jgi:signal transduction histidine kinase
MSFPALDHVRAWIRICAAALPSPPGPLTLDLLRSDLSHETAAKSALISGLCAEWRRGRYRREDAAETDRLLDDLEKILLRWVRLGMTTFSSVWRIRSAFVPVIRLRSLIRPLRRNESLRLPVLEEIRRESEWLDLNLRGLVEHLSAQHGARLHEIVLRSTDAVRREKGSGIGPGSVAIEIDDRELTGVTWVPRGDAALWEDLFRNLIRNAVEATERKEKGSSEPVQVRLGALQSGHGLVVEIKDQGVGMESDRIHRIWDAGHTSNHSGPGAPRSRGQGLTESKREFLTRRAALDVRSVPGRGTTFRIEVPFRDVSIAPVPLWNLRPLLTLALVILIAASSVFAHTWSRTLVTVDGVYSTVVTARDKHGSTIWTRPVGERVVPNWVAPSWANTMETNATNHPAIVRDPRGRPAGVVFASQAEQGPCHLWFVTPDGMVRRKRTASWSPPDTPCLGRLNAVWIRSMRWPGLKDEVVAVQIRDNKYTPSLVAFFSGQGDSLGAYYHWGQLQIRCTADLDRDGRTEILLFGVANHAESDRTVVPFDPRCYVDCLVLLEAPRVNGQAYPYTDWSGMPPADEEAYVLFPPLRAMVRGEITDIEAVAPAAHRPYRIEVALRDGRIFQLDEHLLPLSCTTADQGLARDFGADHPMPPITYFSRGVRQSIDVPIRERGE